MCCSIDLIYFWYLLVNFVRAIYSFLLLFGQFDNIYKVEQDSLYFFLVGGFKGIYLIEKNCTLSYVISEI